MFQLAPSKADQSGLRYWSRNRYKAHVNGVRWTNRAYTEAPELGSHISQIRFRPILMTEEQRAAVLRLTGSTPYNDRTFVPVARGRAKSLTRKAKKA